MFIKSLRLHRYIQTENLKEILYKRGLVCAQYIFLFLHSFIISFFVHSLSNLLFASYAIHLYLEHTQLVGQGRTITLCIINQTFHAWSDSGIVYPHSVQVSRSSRMPYPRYGDFWARVTDSDTINNDEGMVTTRLVPTVPNTRPLFWAPFGLKNV